ncbi:alpha/beta fold hydrolase [Roseovarius sp. M141]|uniref:alpha/beta fold hydrolase n=1 Tax=Roseovarius sp. M141 TaxID=2583806 RepID=UPI0020CEA015|nr:alpha/beta fold hydrolase [Roseovarius sp. M141]MCQ0093848.1 alpha/beta fold hydrolase [Roseovarius sp. M141]
MLNMIDHGVRTDAPTLLIAHGLYGSARNWGVIARRLADTRRVVAVDLRNHGMSDWKDTHSYADLAADLAEICEALDGPVDVLGHSMGGKAAMTLAMTQPALVNRLIVADIAPVAYGHSQLKYLDAMRRVDLSRIEKRSDATALLEPLVDDPALVPFFLQSLDVAGRRWRLNLDVLADEMPQIMGFPDLHGSFERPALFLTGEASDYVQPEHREVIKSLFPKARFTALKGAGHWLHAEEPRAFVDVVRGWLER